MQKLEVFFYWVLMVLFKFGDVVFDLFFGIGIIGVVVKKFGCNFVGVECEQDYIDVVMVWIDVV